MKATAADGHRVYRPDRKAERNDVTPIRSTNPARFNQSAEYLHERTEAAATTRNLRTSHGNAAQESCMSPMGVVDVMRKRVNHMSVHRNKTGHQLRRAVSIEEISERNRWG